MMTRRQAAQNEPNMTIHSLMTILLVSGFILPFLCLRVNQSLDANSSRQTQQTLAVSMRRELALMEHGLIAISWFGLTAVGCVEHPTALALTMPSVPARRPGT
jgi:hypothetical protein